MDSDVDEFLEELSRISAELQKFSALTSLRNRTEYEDIFEEMHYFLLAALENSGNVNRYVDFMLANKKGFAAIGAVGCLQALENLLPFHEADQTLLTEDGRQDYFLRTLADRDIADRPAEGCVEFGRLLLAYARKHADQFGLDTSHLASYKPPTTP